MKTRAFLTACLINAASITIAGAETVSVADVKMLAKAGMSDEVILSHIRNAHAVFDLSTAEIIDLKDTGVSQKVIDFMINTPTGVASAPVQAAPAPAPVVEVAEGAAAPAVLVETVPVEPGPDYVWVGGYWAWRHTRWGFGRWV